MKEREGRRRLERKEAKVGATKKFQRGKSVINCCMGASERGRQPRNTTTETTAEIRKVVTASTGGGPKSASILLAVPNACRDTRHSIHSVSVIVMPFLLLRAL